MGELTNYFDAAKRVIQIQNDNSTKPGFSPIFEFPFTDDYFIWINIQEKKYPKEGRRPNYFWNDIYGKIIEREIKHTGILTPSEWNRSLISYPTKSVYLIADVNEKLLYIGKCKYPPIIRLLDRMIPRSFNQLNNVPQIWNNYISQGKKVKCAYCHNLSFDPEILESYLIHEYCIQEEAYQIFNRKMPTGEFYKKVLEIKSKLII